jgi:hypothetical protein
MLRTLIRDKGNLVAERSDWIRRLQKGFDQICKKKRNSASTRVAAALRMAALSVRHSQTALGAPAVGPAIRRRRRRSF